MNTRKSRTRALLFGVFFALIAMPVYAQTKRLPAVAYGAADFAKLRWLSGSWQGLADGESPLYEKIAFVDDSTAEITYYRDSAFTQELGTGRLYLSVGRVYHTFGANRWAASKLGPDLLFFVPQTNARNTFAWKYESPDEWTATMRSGVSGHERVTVFHMTRVK